ncbi:hypothetical protein GRI40_08980 [Altererythrobacter aerius]|uniref:Uncharacterized protein n=1 Tax=Tsuneonella aeria TaxID=1837929 RepID=A0A6I4TGZ5_9SPHN|nr:hypothetical protein [Tsuneonella aeria]MXO75345.1 hypothetical protein [Tsuneonella aeria]
MTGRKDGGASNASGKGAKSLKTLDLDKLISKYEAASPVGPVVIRRLTMSDHIAIEKADNEQRLDANELVRLLIERSVKRRGQDEPLASDEVIRLSGDPEFLEELIAGHPDLTTFNEKDAPTDAQEGSVDDDDMPPVRGDGETAGEYLLRAWRAYHRHFTAKFRGVGEALAKQLSGLTGALSASGLQSLTKNFAASRGLQEAIDKATTHAQPRWSPTFEPSRFEPIELPPNPIHETNEHLNQLVGSIDQMRDLAVKTAEMQRGLNDVATEILDKFVTGANAAEQASTKNLKIAKIGLGIAVASIIVTLLVSIAQIVMSGPSQQETEQMSRMEALARDARNQSARQEDLLKQVVDFERMRARDAAEARRAAQSRGKPN